MLHGHSAVPSGSHQSSSEFNQHLKCLTKCSKNQFILGINPTIFFYLWLLDFCIAFGHLPLPVNWLLWKYSQIQFAFTVLSGGRRLCLAQGLVQNSSCFLFPFLFSFLRHIPGIVMCMHNGMWAKNHALAKKKIILVEWERDWLAKYLENFKKGWKLTSRWKKYAIGSWTFGALL